MRYTTKDLFLPYSEYDILLDTLMGPSNNSTLRVDLLESIDFEKKLVPLVLGVIFGERYSEEGNEGYIELVRWVLLKVPEHISANPDIPESFLIQLKLMIDNYRDPSYSDPDFFREDIDNAGEFIYDLVENHSFAKDPIDLTEVSVDEPILLLQSLPSNERWRLYIDGNKQRNPEEHGWQAYENREKNCILAMHNALDHALTDYQQPLTIDKIIKIHDIALGGVEGNVMEGLRSSGTSTGFAHYSLDRVATVDPSDESKKYDSTMKYNSKNVVMNRYFQSTSTEKLKTYINSEIESYERKLNEADGSIDKKLEAIVEFGYNMLKKHPFRDGNSRTFITILLNKELIRNGFSPCILDDPLIFESYVGNHELRKEVVNGIRNFKKLLSENVIENLPSSLTTAELAQKQAPPTLSDFTVQSASYAPSRPRR